MHLKKLVSLTTAAVLSFTLVFGCAANADSVSEEKMKLMIAAGEVPPGNAVDEKNVKIKRDAAVEIAKKFLEDASRYQTGNMWLNPKWGGSKGSLWSIEFYRNEAPYGNANVTIDADTGEVFSFNIWDSYDAQKNFVAKLTRSEAKKIAEEYLKNRFKIDLSTFELQKEDPYLYSYRMGGVKEQVLYNFNYFKKINGIRLNDYSINVSVDGTDGKVRGFNTNAIDLDALKLPSAEGVLPVEQAMEKYKESTNIGLQYITVYDEKPYAPAKPRVMLAYVPLSYIGMMDAKTGLSVNYDGSTADLTKTPLKELLENPVPMNPDAKLESKKLTEAQVTDLANKYKELAEKMLGIKIDNNNGNNYYRPYGAMQDQDIWNFNWYTNNEKFNASVNVSINAVTGHITNMGMSKYENYSSPQQQEVKEKIDWKAGREKAVELVKKIVPEYYGFFADQNLEEPVMTAESKKYMREYYYTFARVANGIRCRDNTISVAIDRETGEMKNFFINWSDIEFPETANIISKEDAADKYFDGTEAVLSYFLLRTYDKATGAEKISENPRLVYTFNTKGYMYGSMNVDAVTGKIVDWSGREVKLDAVPGEAQLPEHWAKRSVELLTAQGIIKTPYVDFDAELTKMEAVKMLSTAKGMNYYYDSARPISSSFADIPKEDENYPFVENAVRQKIIEAGRTFNGSEKISKEEFVKLLVNFMGYGHIAGHEDIFTVNEASNVSPELKGYVAICSALGVLPVKAGEAFDASEKVTYAEAASALYKALEFVK